MSSLSNLISNVNIGTTANDGTGDPLRTAFQKINSNFSIIDAYISANYYTKSEVNALFNSYVQNAFTTIAVAGQANVIADSNSDVLTFVAGTGVTITTDSANDKITFSLT